MLTQTEILNEIFTLPIYEQREIAKKIESNIKQNNEDSTNELSIQEKTAIVKSLAGSLKMENPPMSKGETREMYYEYLSEKHK